MSEPVDELMPILRDRLARRSNQLAAEAALACPDIPGAWEMICEWMAEEEGKW